MKKNECKINKMNNKGSALVVVVIVIAFITVLATLILYVSVMNFHMKSNDYNTKVSFYGAEIPLEELRVQMVLDFSQACEKSYRSVFEQYGTLIGGAGIPRKSEYVGGIMEELQAIWDDRGGAVASSISTMLKDTASDEYHVITGSANTLDCSDPDCECAHHIILVDMEETSPGSGVLLPRLELDETAGKATLHNIKSVYTENGYTSVVYTDFCFLIPEYDWSVDEYEDDWDDGPQTLQRTQIDYEKCVVYLNWTKQ